MPRAIVIGAGMAGLIAARRLQKAGWEVEVLEKSRGFGGRMATRRFEGARFDHGAQYFTLHSMFFRSLVETLQDENLAAGWCRGFLNTDRLLIMDGYQRFYAPEGMNTIAKFIAEPLTVHLQTQVTHLELSDAGWQVMTADQSYSADAVIITAPVPQAFQLLKKSPDLTLDIKQAERLKDMKYNPCIALMAILDGPSGLPEPGAIRFEDPMNPVMWIADNVQKGISEVHSVTVHGTPHFSRKHWKIPREEAGNALWEAAQKHLDANMIQQQTHGWRFSQPKDVQEENCLRLKAPFPLYLAGDSFGDANNLVEGAVLSGLEAARQLLKEV